MSGGSWDYISFKFDEVADRLLRSKCPYRRALGRQVSSIGQALHEIEWVDSGDCSEGIELPFIKSALGEFARELAFAELVKEADRIMSAISELKLEFQEMSK